MARRSSRSVSYTHLDVYKRQVWLTTIFGLDWPKVSADTYPGMVRQQESLDKMLDAFVQAGINTVFLQVRLRGDLLYPSGLESLSPTVSKTCLLYTSRCV